MKKIYGFSLLEILIVLAMVGIISRWIMTNYQSSIATSKRHIAVSALYSLGSSMEEYAMQHMGYQHASLLEMHVPELIAEKSYLLRIDKAEEMFYQISAVPDARQEKIDTACGMLTMNSRGEKFISGNGKVDGCW